MNIYKVLIQRGSSVEEMYVVARSTAKVSELVEKYAKKNYWYSFRINTIEYIRKPDIIQK